MSVREIVAFVAVAILIMTVAGIIIGLIGPPPSGQILMIWVGLHVLGGYAVAIAYFTRRFLN